MAADVKALQVVMVLLLAAVTRPSAAVPYAWPHGPVLRTIHNLATPARFHRVELAANSFGAWLRELPLLADGATVRLWNGKEKPYQVGHVAVVDLDVGNQDLQQCADAILRLRAEFLWAMVRAGEVDKLPGNTHHWQGGDRRAFRRYLNSVMATTGTATMAQSMAKPAPGHKLMPGDVLVQGGHPGHAILVLDAADDDKGNRRVLLGQSYMPAQQFHVMAPPSGSASWFDEEPLRTTGIRTLSWAKHPFVAGDVRVFEAEKRVGVTR